MTPEERRELLRQHLNEFFEANGLKVTYKWIELDNVTQLVLTECYDFGFKDALCTISFLYYSDDQTLVKFIVPNTIGVYCKEYSSKDLFNVYYVFHTVLKPLLIDLLYRPSIKKEKI